MLKTKSLSLITILSFLFVCLLAVNKAYARGLTSTERYEYGQNNILFYTPCDTEDDCESGASTADQEAIEEWTPPDEEGEDGDGEEGGGGDPGDPMTPSGAGASLIVSTARAMAWPTTAGTCRNKAGTYVPWEVSSVNKNAPCQDTMSDYLKSIGQTNLIRDCGKFVGLVMRKSVDPSFQASGVKYQIPYMNKSNNWTKVSTDGQEFSWSNLHPGDVLAASENGHGHIMIWYGSNKTVKCKSGSCTVNVASSSFGTRSPSMNKISKLKYCYDGGATCTPYKVYRWTGNTNNNDGGSTAGQTINKPGSNPSYTKQ